MLKQLIDAICVRLVHGSRGWTPPAFEIAKLEIKPGDFLVLRFKERLNAQQVDCLRAAVERQLPSGVKALVFDGQVDLQVLAPLPDRSQIAA